jgi:hypothetical protein
VGIAATGFCHPGGILHHHRQDLHPPTRLRRRFRFITTSVFHQQPAARAAQIFFSSYLIRKSAHGSHRKYVHGRKVLIHIWSGSLFTAAVGSCFDLFFISASTTMRCRVAEKSNIQQKNEVPLQVKSDRRRENKLFSTTVHATDLNWIWNSCQQFPIRQQLRQQTRLA